MQARKHGLFNCFSISYSKDCELIVQFNVKFTKVRVVVVATAKIHTEVMDKNKRKAAESLTIKKK